MNILITKEDDLYSARVDVVEEENPIEEFSFAISRAVCRFIHNYDPSQAAGLLSVILESIRIFVTEYINSKEFEEVANLRTEKELYAFMEELFEFWLETRGLTKQEILDKFQGVDTLRFDVKADTETITIFLSNGDGSVREVLNVFDRNVVDDCSQFQDAVTVPYISAVVLADILFCNDEEHNPIRRLECTRGFRDGGLATMIREAIETSEAR